MRGTASDFEVRRFAPARIGGMLAQHLRSLHSMSAIRTCYAVLSGIALLGSGGGLRAGSPEHRQVLQPVHEYLHLEDVARTDSSGQLVLNGFLNYTHLGSDFGFLGPASLHVSKDPGAICADLSSRPNDWAGVWHSLNHLARDNSPLDLAAPYSSLILPAFQPRIVGVQAVASGTGKLKIELKTPPPTSQGKPVEPPSWAQTFALHGGDKPETFTSAVDTNSVRYAQYLNWVAEPGSELCVDSVSLRVELPAVDFPTYVFLASYAKLARCYDENTGLVRDRAHVSQDALNNVAVTGMFALSTAAAERLGMVETETAREVIRRTLKVIDSLPRKNGLLPHFVARRGEEWIALPGAEYSTIDTALCLISLRIAANALHDEATANQALKLLRGVEIHSLRNADGFVLHGVHEDGKPIPFYWRDWGGETALVLMMQRIVAGSSLAPMMDESGRSHRGIGFITELPALFFPQFNTNVRARAGSVDWRAYRQLRLAEQKKYFAQNAPHSLAAQLGLYGLSAGEGSRGIGYHTAGTEDPEQKLIYPHYILMSALMEPNTATVYEMLQTLENRGWLTPWGLVENIDADGKSYVPMISSLNGAFESLAAYHLLMAHRGEQDELYQFAADDPVFQDALQAIFE